MKFFFMFIDTNTSGSGVMSEESWKEDDAESKDICLTASLTFQ